MRRGTEKWLLSAIVVMTIVGIVLYWSNFLSATQHHEFVSSDGGFVDESGFKVPVRSVESSFELYRFLRDDSSMVLYRTTKLEPFEIFTRAARYEYRPNAKEVPADWRAELKQKCLFEYVPTLPVVLEEDGIKLFFFNQYQEVDLKIHGVIDGETFGLTIRRDPSQSATGKAWDSPIWSHYSEGLEARDDDKGRIWRIVRSHQDELIKRWDQDRSKFTSGFDPHYNGLF